MFVRSELKEIIVDVLNDYLPKVKRGEKIGIAEELIVALEDMGMEVDEDPFEGEKEEEEDLANYVDFEPSDD